MVDVRKKIEEDRGLLKKIQKYVPGFSGYRSKEDLRSADNHIRIQMANRLAELRDGLEECRRVLSKDYRTALLEDLGALINRIMALEGRVRHAEQGYSGISPSIRIEEEELENLYEYDYNLIERVLLIEEAVTNLRKAIDARDEGAMDEQIEGMRTLVADFDRTFRERLERVAGIFNF